jgi:hypothetical protein
MKRRFLNLSAAILGGIVVAVLAAGPAVKRHVEAMRCGNQMASIGCAARIWAADHNRHFPSDLLSMSNEINLPVILICPSDHTRQAAANWSSLTVENSSYEIVTPELRDGDTNGVFLRCKIHGSLGYADATVFDGSRRRTKVIW